MESSLKNLLNNSNASSIPGMKKKEKKQPQNQKQEKTEDCTKKLFSLPSSVLSENFAEKIKKENFQKLGSSETSQKSKKRDQKENEFVTVTNPLKNLFNENSAKNSASKNSAKISLAAEKINLPSANEAASKILANASAPMKDLNVSSIEYAAEEVSKLNLNNSLANLLSAPVHLNSKINDNLISLNNNNKNNLNSNANSINKKNSNSNSNANANGIKNEPAQQTQKQEVNPKNSQSNQIIIPSTPECQNPKADPVIVNSVQNLSLNSDLIIPEESLTVVPKPRGMTISSYIEREVEIYSNLYPIKLTKKRTLFTYYLDFQGDSEHINTYLKRKIISRAYLDLIPLFGIYFFSGENFYATEEIKDVTNIISVYNKVKYSFLIRPLNDFFKLEDYNENHKNRSLFKNILEIIYKDILKANPDIKMMKNMCSKKCSEKVVTSRDNKVLVIPAFSTKIMLLEAGIFLNVDNKNKILNGEDCLKLIRDQLKNPAKPTAVETKKVNETFRDRIVETKHTNQRFKIDCVSFDRTPKNTNLNVDGNNIPMNVYYKKLYGFSVEEFQPLLLLKNTAQRKTNVGRYYPAELCFLSGLTDQMAADGKLMMNISKNTKLNPEQKVEEIDTILSLLNATAQKKTKEGVTLPSSVEKMDNYGIKILKTNENTFKGFTMKPPIMLGGERDPLRNIMKPFKILDAKPINYICLYHKLYTNDMKTLDDSIRKAGVSYGIKIGNSENVEMNSENTDEWIKTIKAKLDTKQFNFVFILLDDYLQVEGFYSPLKKHSLETMGYPMQVILTNSLYKNTMSVVSNILLQANSKLGGSLFKIQIPREIKEKNLMAVGIDISALKGQNRLNIAMCATTNPDLTEYYSSKTSVPIEQDGQTNRNLCFNVSAFIHEAVMEFFRKNRNMPKGVIIYRQGVSKEQRTYLTEEVLGIEKMLSGKCENQLEQEIYSNNPIPYYYVLVNKKTSLKFFEKEKVHGKYGYNNPECGLLILNDLTDSDEFEFYIQPQKVNQGTATPTNFHVAYGNLNMPEYIPKITYDMCYMYSNWRGPVRVPAPLKYAEKLAKAEHNLHKNSKLKLYHL